MALIDLLLIVLGGFSLWEVVGLVLAVGGGVVETWPTTAVTEDDL